MVKYKAAAQLELLFNKPEVGLLNIYVILKWQSKVWLKSHKWLLSKAAVKLKLLFKINEVGLLSIYVVLKQQS
jgi:hypothetical protein